VISEELVRQELAKAEESKRRLRWVLDEDAKRPPT